MEKQKPRIAKTILHNKGASGGVTVPDIKLYYSNKTITIYYYYSVYILYTIIIYYYYTVIKTAWY